MNVIPSGALWVRLPRFIGDSVMIHQALEPLRKQGLPLVAWGPGFITELFEESGAFISVWPDGPGKGNAWALSRLLRRYAPAAVINLPRSTRALAAAWLARVPVRVGWRAGGGFLLATHSLPFRIAEHHQFELYQTLLEKAFPGLPRAQATPFRPRSRAIQEAKRALEGLRLPQDRYVILGLGAMAWQKRLGTPIWIKLIERLQSNGIPHVLLGGIGDDQAQAAEILKLAPGVPDLTGRLPLSSTAAVVAGARLLVGNDSALGHIAAACGTPAVLAFGPTRPECTAPVGSVVKVVRKEGLTCLGCLQDCNVPGHPCMQQLDPDALWQALEEFLITG